MALACKGLLDPHPRVRNQALMAVGLVMSECAPQVQMRFHSELMPVLLKMAEEETYLKLKS